MAGKPGDYKRGMRTAYVAATKSLLEDLRKHAVYLDQRDLIKRYEDIAEEEAERRAHEDRTPLGPATWIENEYFCGHLARDMYDKLKEEFIDVYENNIFEIIMGGSIGWGKTTFALACNVYSLYLMCCYGTPQRAFRGMMESAIILFMNMNTKQEKARNAYFRQLDILLRSIPYFQRDHPLQPNLVNSIVLPDKGIVCKFSGATKTAAESENLIFCVLDEVNLYDKVERSKRADQNDDTYDAAETVYTSALRRMHSRYMLPDGKMPAPAKLISLCKETYPESFIRRLIADSQRRGLDKKKRVKIMEYSEWETKPPGTYQKTYFYIQTGSRASAPRILYTPQEVAEAKTRLEELKASPSTDKDLLYEVIRAPTAGGEYIMSAEKDLPNFIRDVCGRPTQAVNIFYTDRTCIYKCTRRPSKDIPALVCDHPFSAEVTTFQDGVFLMKERLAEQLIMLGDDGRPMLDEEGAPRTYWRPLVNPYAHRFIHVDTALTKDSLGFAMGHICGWRDVLRADEDDKTVVEKAPVIWFDVLLRVEPPKGGEIIFDKVRGLIYKLAQLGFKIYKVTLDSYQSRDFIQLLGKKGYDAEVLSMDLSPEPHHRLRRAYMEGRVSVYPYAKSEEELGGLERILTGQVKGGNMVEKIDHPPHGSKDVADAEAGVADNIETYATEIVENTAPSKYIERASSKLDVARETASLFNEGKWERLQEMMADVEDYDG